MSEAMSSYKYPASVVSAGHYMSYLWLGHCVHQPGDYRQDISDFHKDRENREYAYAWFQNREAHRPATVLIDQLKRVVKNAKTELGLDTRIDPRNRRLLQVHLVGEVSVRGMEMAHYNGLIEDYPDLAAVTSPFVDGRVIDGALRSIRTGRTSESFARYATMERLLPGYEVATTSEKEF